jgi:ribosomal protein S27AE
MADLAGELQPSVAAIPYEICGDTLFAPRYYCPRCGPTNRIASAHGRLICIVCEFDLAQQVEFENARPPQQQS